MMSFSQAAPPMPMSAAAIPGHGQILADSAADQLPRLRRKRKADTQDANHERLNKRMSLLNLEQNGPKLYVPVEQSLLPSNASSTTSAQPSLTSTTGDEPMHLDDTKHKVYIYNLDDELSSSDSEDPEGSLVILPDLAAHLKANRLRVPRPIPLHPDDLQVVLYQPDGPPSLSVPAEQDGVRKAIVAARERVRERQALERGGRDAALANASSSKRATVSFATPVKFPSPALRDGEVEMVGYDQARGQSSAGASGAGGFESGLDTGYDPDAMDID